MTLMRAVGFTSPGLIENLQIVSRQVPALKENECLLKVYYSAINRADTLQRKGLYPPPPNESDILGLEATGVICKTQPGLKWKQNERVMALLGGGGNAEYVAVNEKTLMRIPDEMSFEQAAAITEVWLTAFQLIYWISSVVNSSSLTGREVKDTTFLVHAGASGVGTSLIQILKKVLNVRDVYATCGSGEKKRFLEENLNVTRAINYKEESFEKSVRELTGGRGVDVVFDCVGGSYWRQNLESLAVDGEWVLYGLMGGGSVDGDILKEMLRKRIHLKSTTLRARSIEVAAEFFSVCFVR